MKIAVGSDHRGFELKNKIAAHLKENGFEVIDKGTYTPDKAEYPVYGEKVGRCVAGGEADFGVVVCGTGFGISLGASAVSGIRAACVSDIYTARYVRLHNNANVLALGALVVGEGLAYQLVDAFLSEPFLGGRHERRVAYLDEIRRRNDPETGLTVSVPVGERVLTVYNQRNKRFTHPYCDEANPDGNLSSSGCGIFSCCELIEFMSGKTVSPEDMADFSCRVGGRDETGTNRPMLLKGIVDNGLDAEYGFNYVPADLSNDHDALWAALTSGGCAMCNLRTGHITSLIGAREVGGEKQVLVLDCHSESADERVAPFVREVLPESAVTCPVRNEAGVITGYNTTYAAFWVPLTLCKNFNIINKR